MVYSTLLKGVLRLVYGALPASVAPGPGGGLVLVLDGVGRLDLLGTNLKYVAALEKLPHTVHIFPWGHGFGRWVADLIDVRNHKAQTAKLAAEVEEFRAAHAGAPVFLVGKSGGTGVLVWGLEQLPPDSVERAVLVAPALSANYDLSRALRAVRTEMVVFWSPLDLFILGVGTMVFGTIDRVHAESAGLTGFREPKELSAEDRAQYSKLRHVRWEPSMMSTLYLGGHVGPDSPFFLRRYVLPLLCADPAPEVPQECQANPVADR